MSHVVNPATEARTWLISPAGRCLTCSVLRRLSYPVQSFDTAKITLPTILLLDAKSAFCPMHAGLERSIMRRRLELDVRWVRCTRSGDLVRNR